MKNEKGFAGIIMTILIVIIGAAIAWGYPQWRVWQLELSGKAILREAEWSRKVTIEEAKALKESAVLYADAEVIRARGVSQANEIIADGLGGPEGYLRYLYINNVTESRNNGADLIYIPTEAGLPILEAGRIKGE